MSQNIRLFRDMTAVENLLVAQHTKVHRNLLGGVLNSQKYRQSEAKALLNAYHWLDFCEFSTPPYIPVRKIPIFVKF